MSIKEVFKICLKCIQITFFEIFDVPPEGAEKDWGDLSAPSPLETVL